jgi:hypothetical protein
MPPALRPGPGSGPKLLGVLAGVVLALALVVTGRVLGGPDPPSPVRPPAAGPVACYATVADAAAAGYPQAPLPAGALELGGVYLVPVPEGVRRDCRRAAGRLGFAVPCPRLRPTPSLGAPLPAVCPRPCGDPGFGFLLEDTGFLVPSGYVGAYPEVGRRLVVAAARRPAPWSAPGHARWGRRGSAGASVACSSARPARARTTRACCCAGATAASSWR